MERFQNLLYVAHPLAGSSRGFSCALEVARAQGARLTLLASAPPPLPRDGSGVLTPGAARCRDALVRQARLRLDRLASMGRAADVAVRVRVLPDDPAEVVLREVAREGHDLVVKVPDTSGLSWPWRLHRTDRRLLRECPCPVWMLAPAQGPGMRVVLAGVDVGPGRSPELNERIVGVAASLAAPEAELHVLHAWSIVGEPILASTLTGLSRSRMRSLLARTRRARRQRVEGLVARAAPGRSVRLALPKEDAIRALRRQARCREADVVVVGNSARTGLEGLLLGNVPERLVGRVPASVVAVRPEPAGTGREPAGVAPRRELVAAGFAGDPA